MLGSENAQHGDYKQYVLIMVATMNLLWHIIAKEDIFANEVLHPYVHKQNCQLKVLQD